MSEQTESVETQEQTSAEVSAENQSQEPVIDFYPEEKEEAQEAKSEEVSEESNESEQVEVKAETEEELEQELQEAADAGATKEELTNMVRQFTLKVNNKEYIKEIDLSDEEAIKRELQMALAGQQAMQHKAQLERAYQNDIERLKNDPWAVLEELGLDPVDLSAKKIEDYLAQKAKSPEEVEQEQRQREFEQLKQENERLKREFEERQRAAALSQAEKEIEADIIGALESDNELEASPEVINMVVDTMLFAMDNGIDNVTAKDVLPTVKRELQSRYRAYAKSMKSTTALKSLLGDDVLNNLKEERIEKIKNQIPSVNSIKTTAKKDEKEEERKKISLSDFMGGR